MEGPTSPDDLPTADNSKNSNKPTGSSGGGQEKKDSAKIDKCFRCTKPIKIYKTKCLNESCVYWSQFQNPKEDDPRFLKPGDHISIPALGYKEHLFTHHAIVEKVGKCENGKAHIRVVDVPQKHSDKKTLIVELHDLQNSPKKDLHKIIKYDYNKRKNDNKETFARAMSVFEGTQTEITFSCNIQSNNEREVNVSKDSVGTSGSPVSNDSDITNNNKKTQTETLAPEMFKLKKNCLRSSKHISNCCDGLSGASDSDDPENKTLEGEIYELKKGSLPSSEHTNKGYVGSSESSVSGDTDITNNAPKTQIETLPRFTVVGSKSYHLFVRNCEHFAVDCVNGSEDVNFKHSTSLQSNRLFIVLFHVLSIMTMVALYLVNVLVYIGFVGDVQNLKEAFCIFKGCFKGKNNGFANTICDWIILAVYTGLMCIIAIVVHVYRRCVKSMCTECICSSTILMFTKIVCICGMEAKNYILERGWLELYLNMNLRWGFYTILVVSSLVESLIVYFVLSEKTAKGLTWLFGWCRRCCRKCCSCCCDCCCDCCCLLTEHAYEYSVKSCIL